MEVQVEGKTLGSLLYEVASERGEACFLKWETGSWSYSEFVERVDEIAKGLLACGVKHGDRVALWAGNHPDWIACYFAIVSVGGILVTVNTRYHADELRYELEQSDASLIILDRCFLKENLLDRLIEVAPELESQMFGSVESKALPCLKGAIVLDGPEMPGVISLDTAIGRGRDVATDELRRVQAASLPEDVALMIYTSGTTGNPKGVAQQHYALLNRMQRFAAWNEMREGDATFFALPLFHSFGAVVAVIGTLVSGSQLCIRQKFRAREALETIEREHCSVIHGVPSAFFMMLKDPEFARFDLSCGRTGVLGGAPCPPELAREITEKIAPHIAAAWGQTETCGMVTASAPGDTVEQITQTVGHVIPGSELAIVESESGRAVAVGELGEVLVRSPYNMLGYYRMEAATQEAIDEEGWLHTGDVGFMGADGCLRIVGRLKDMFIVGGVNAYPSEIENHIRKLEGVDDVQVVGVPDERLGEVACAYVIEKDKGALSDEKVIEHCRSLANYKIPRFVRFVDEFPMTANGKVKKFVLRDAFIEEIG